MNVFRFVAIQVLFFSTTACANAQDSSLNKYGLWVLASVSQLNKTVAQDSSKAMLDVKKNIKGIKLDLRYATENNFMHTKLYPPITTTYLRKAAVDALRKVQEELKPKGLGLKIFDAYRPYSVTEKIWEPVKDDRYAADPKKGSGHNRGAAVDLTVINLKTGKELDMGTGFDNFSDTAHHAFTNLPAAVLQNRKMFKEIMERNGFNPFDTEWWHYSLPEIKKYELLDISFTALKRKK